MQNVRQDHAQTPLVDEAASTNINLETA